MSSAAVCLPPPADQIRVYHLTSARYALNNIDHRRIKVARFSEANDPFELLAVSMSTPGIRSGVRSLKRSLDETDGFLSFTENWSSPVLWAHYADRHRGICLGFDLPRDSVQKVSYKDDRIRMKLGDSEVPDNLPTDLKDQLKHTKSSHWEYEQEFRRIVPLKNTKKVGKLNFVLFDSSLQLKEVILGPYCPNSQFGSIQRLVRSRYPGAVIIRSRLAWRSFRVVPSESSIP
jgi:hypothetical protein